jgi:hypothetical protein
MIATKERDNQPRAEVVTSDRTRTEPDAMEKEKRVEKWIRKAVEPMPTFNPQKEKETYQQGRKEILVTDYIESTSKTYDMLSVYDHIIPERLVEKVNTLKEFPKSCLELMQD